MKFSCPNCTQILEADDSYAGQTINCPSCEQPLLLPAVEAPAPMPIPAAPRHAAPPKLQRPGSDPSQPPARTYKRKSGGPGGFLLVLVLLALGGFVYGMVHFHESPQQLWQRILHAIEQLIQPAPAPTPTPTPAPTPEPTSTPAPSATPMPTATPAPTPLQDPVAWLQDHQESWPRVIVLTQDTKFRLLTGGANSVITAPAGTEVKFVRMTPNTVVVDAYGGVQQIYISSTDLRQRAEAAMKAAVVATPTPAPSPSASPSPEVASSEATSEDQTPSSESVDEDAAASATPTHPGDFVHPGLLSNEADFQRMRQNRGREPWKSGFEMLTKNPHASLNWTPKPAEVVIRGSGRDVPGPQNYGALYNDVAAAYACALRWKMTGDSRYARKSVEIMNAWSSTLKKITGSTDADLAAGIYGYEFANAAEIMRTYKGWKPEDFAAFQKMMLTVFYPINKDFLDRHNGTPIDHYWANWDLCNIASVLAIGVLCDRHDIYSSGIRYFKFGKGNGAIMHAVYYVHPGGLGQWQESGRDQGHTTLGIALGAAICEMAWKQGDDLYGYADNRFLKGCEYVAKYNLGEDVPYKPFSDSLATQPVISDGSRGTVRAGWELVYNHYVVLKKLAAPYSTRMAEKARPEGGGGDYGPNSGGYDQLGYGTLTATLDPAAANSSPSPGASFFGEQTPAQQ